MQFDNILALERYLLRGKYARRRQRRLGLNAPITDKDENAIRSLLIPNANKPGDSIAVFGNGKQKRQAQYALRCVDAVHGNHLNFDPIPLTFEVLPKNEDAFCAYDFTAQRTVNFKVDTHNTHVAFSVVHEVGHHLDASSIGTPDGWGSENEECLDEFRRAVFMTPEIQNLIKAEKTKSLPVIKKGIKRVVLLTEKEYKFVSYLLRGHEVFARAYAQFIAVESQSQILKNQLNFYRGPYYKFRDSQWGDENFEPVRVALRKLLKEELGWIQ